MLLWFEFPFVVVEKTRVKVLGGKLGGKCATRCRARLGVQPRYIELFIYLSSTIE